MTIWDWLVTPGGQAVAHGLELVLIALAAWLSSVAARRAAENGEKLNSHLHEHIASAYTAGAARGSQENDDR